MSRVRSGGNSQVIVTGGPLIDYDKSEMEECGRQIARDLGSNPDYDTAFCSITWALGCIMEIAMCTFSRVAVRIKWSIKTSSTMPRKWQGRGGIAAFVICKILEKKTPQRAFRMIK